MSATQPASALACQRDAFALPPGTHYLNCAYMSPLAHRVERAGVRGLRRKRAPHTIEPSDFFRDGNRVRRRAADLINAESPDRIALVPSVSYGVAVAARNTPIDRGQSIVLATEQFPSNVYLWRRLARDAGAELRVVGRLGVGAEPSITDAVLDAIDATTSVVALGTVHWTDGTVLDTVAIGERARAVGAAYVLDGTQSIGALPFDVRTVRPDALIVAGYKWLLGPYGIAFAYYGERYADATPIEEPWIVREGSEDFRALVDYRDAYRPGALRFDGGGMSNFITVPMLDAAIELLQEWTVPAIQAYCAELVAPLRAAAAMRGWSVSSGASHIVGLRLPAGGDPSALRARMDAAGVSVSLRGSAVRVSPHVYNDEADVAALIAVLEEML